MAEDDERRSNRNKSGRRDMGRGPRRDPPVIEGKAEEVEPVPDVPASQTDIYEAGGAGVAASPDTPGSQMAHSDPVASADPIVPSEPAAEASLFEPVMTEFKPVENDPAEAHTPAADPEVAAVEPTPEPVEAAAEAREPWTAPSARDDAFTPAPPRQEQSSSVLPALLGVILFVLAAAVAYLLFQGPSRTADTGPALSDLQTRLAALEAKPQPVDPSALTQRIDGLDATVGSLKASLADLAKKVDATPAAPVAAAAPAAPAAPDLGPQVSALDSKLADVTRDLASVQAAVAAVPKTDLTPIDTRISDLDGRVGSLQGAVAALPHVDLGPVMSRIEGLDGQFRSVEAGIGAAKSAQQTADLRQKDSAAEARAAALAVAAQTVSDAVASGQPFAQPLKTLQMLGADDKALAPLQQVATQGAPSLDDLRADLANARDRIIAQGTTPSTGSYVDRLMAGAGTLVRVRPLGSVVGDTPSAIVARMDAAIGADELARALQEWSKLPDASKAAAKGLSERIELRLNAETAAKAIGSGAIGAMTAAKG